MDTRGRGLSADHPDHSPERLVQDVTAFAASIGEPVGLPQRGDILWARAATVAGAVTAGVTVHKAFADEAMGVEVAWAFSDVVARMRELVGEGRLIDAARAVIDRSGFMYTDEDLATGAPLDFWLGSAPNVPVFLQEIQ